jgi:hypothetical protein
VRAAELGTFRLYLSDDILAETERVLLEDRRHLRRGYRYSDQAAIHWCRAVAGVAHIVADPPTLEVVERDPNDNMINRLRGRSGRWLRREPGQGLTFAPALRSSSDRNTGTVHGFSSE